MERLIVRNRITWQREKGRGAKTNWKNGMEDIWYATMSNDYTFNLEDVLMRRKVIAPYRKMESRRLAANQERQLQGYPPVKFLG